MDEVKNADRLGELGTWRIVNEVIERYNLRANHVQSLRRTATQPRCTGSIS